MSNQLQNICVFIDDEKQLQEARELLERFGQRISKIVPWRITSDLEFNYLNLQTCEDGYWFIGWSNYCKQITLTELEKLLEDEKPNP